MEHGRVSKDVNIEEEETGGESGDDMSKNHERCDDPEGHQTREFFERMKGSREREYWTDG